MKEKKKKNTGLKITIAILLLLLLGCVSFILYDKVLKDYIYPVKQENDDSGFVEKEDLNINSRLVQSLYNQVTSDQKISSYYIFWKYSFIENGSNEQFDYSTDFDTVVQDFYVSKAKSSTKMLFIADKLYGQTSINCNNSIEKQNSYGKSSCYDFDGTYKGTTLFYSKNVVENVYKELYGDDAVLDTNAPIFMDLYRGKTFVYNDHLNGYVEYYIETGGISGPGGYTTSLDQAERDGKNIHLYQDVVYTYYDENDMEGSNPLTKKARFKYTFKQDSDGLYTFVSRTVEK